MSSYARLRLLISLNRSSAPDCYGHNGMREQESALESRPGKANLPERWSLETFPYTREPGVNRTQIRALAEFDFVTKH